MLFYLYIYLHTYTENNIGFSGQLTFKIKFYLTHSAKSVKLTVNEGKLLHKPNRKMGCKSENPLSFCFCIALRVYMCL